MKQLTAFNHIEFQELPQEVTVEGHVIDTSSFQDTLPHLLLTNEGTIQKAMWINPLLALLLRYEEAPSRSLVPGILAQIDKELSAVIKQTVQRRTKHGYMAFTQAHEGIGLDCVGVTRRTYDYLCQTSKKWKRTGKVIATRYPNLGPKTSSSLSLVIIEDSNYAVKISDLVDNPFSKLQLDQEDKIEHTRYLDPLYFHPTTLKENFEGDADSDVMYLQPFRLGTPLSTKLSASRTPGEPPENLFSTLLDKAKAGERKDLVKCISMALDETPIGPATYLTRSNLYNQMQNHKNSQYPMHDAWKKIAAQELENMEVWMDVRKGKFSNAEIEKRYKQVLLGMKKIAKAQQRKETFASVVPTQTVKNIPTLCRRYSTLKEILVAITTPKK
jgi:hypothetical protein